jgi:hypothetical protein
MTFLPRDETDIAIARAQGELARSLYLAQVRAALRARGYTPNQWKDTLLLDDEPIHSEKVNT